MSVISGDGIHLDLNTLQTANLVMMDCIGRNCGYIGLDNSNVVSRHGPGNSVIINSEFYNTYGPNILDVNNGCYTWMLGCNCHDSVAAPYRHNYGIANASFMWLDSCIAGGSAVDGQLYASVGATLYYRNIIPAVPTKKELTGGTVVPY